MVKSIYLQDGEEIFVDDEDYERVSQHTWWKYFNGNARVIANADGKGLPNFLMENSYQMKKGNDFTKRNLTAKGNHARWRKASPKSSSKYKGVRWAKEVKKWRANINVDGNHKYLGVYSNEDDAAIAYNQAVLDYWDGDGYLNVIGEDNRVPLKDYKTNKNIHRTRVGKYGYRGIVKRTSEKYRASIWSEGKQSCTTTFKTVEQAALAYNKCVLYLYSEDAILNDVPMTDELKEFIDNWEIPEKIKQLKE